MKNILKLGVLGIVVATPFVSNAAVRTLKDLIDLVIDYLGYAIPLIMSIAIVVFIYGVYKYFIKVDADRAQAGNYILYGVIGFFLMLSFWGLVNILINTLGLDNNIRGVPFIGTSGGNNNGGYIQNPRSSNNNGGFIQNPNTPNNNSGFIQNPSNNSIDSFAPPSTQNSI